MPLNYSTSVNYKPCPANTYPAACVWAIELGLQPGYQGGPDKAQLYLAFEIVGTERDDGRPFLLGKRFTVTLFDKGNLYPVVDTLLGKVPTASEFNPRNLLGKTCLAEVKHRTRADGSNTAVIESVVTLPHGMDTPEPVSDFLFYDWADKDRAVYDRLPSWLQKVIDQGKDQPKPHLNVVKSEGDEPFNDDVPF